MRQTNWQNFDFVLFSATLLAIAIGVPMIYSATANIEPGAALFDRFFVRQIVYAAAGIALMFLMAAIDYRSWESFYRTIYVLTLGGLIIVFVAGALGVFGAQRWVTLPIFPVQPAELAKVLIIIFLAKYFADHSAENRSLSLGCVLISLLLTALPMAMVYLQPSLGNAIIIGVIWLSLVYIVGIRWWQLGLVGALMVGATPLLWNFVLRDYMKQRILAFLDPSGDPLGTVYNINQARIAIGSGGLFGKGWGQGTQSQLQFLRVRHTDFIFSVIGEELGFVGAVLVLALLLLIIFRLLRAAQVARTPTGRFMAWGVATVVFFQTAVNIAMNLGLAPVAGIPLPFISYGGSSLITLLIAEGLVQSVAMRYKKIEFF